MSDAGYIAVRTLRRISPEQTRDSRARAWAFVFRCWQEKQKAAEPAPEPGGQDDVRESNGYVATDKYTR